MQITLRTDRLVLRRLTATDVDYLVELDSDPDVMRFITGGKPTPRSVVERLGWFALRVPEKAGLRFVRTFHIKWDDPIAGVKHGEVEYELRRADWEAARQSTA